MRDGFMEKNRRECPVCRKEFWFGADWKYKRGSGEKLKRFCSYECVRKYDESRVTLGDMISQRLKAGMSDEEIMAELGVNRRQIAYRRERLI